MGAGNKSFLYYLRNLREYIIVFSNEDQFMHNRDQTCCRVLFGMKTLKVLCDIGNLVIGRVYHIKENHQDERRVLRSPVANGQLTAFQESDCSFHVDRIDILYTSLKELMEEIKPHLQVADICMNNTSFICSLVCCK